MNILVVASNNYPSIQEPQKGTFVYKLIQEFSLLGNRVTVFAPEKLFAQHQKKDINYGNERATVLRPSFLTLSNKNILGFNTFHIGRISLVKTLQRTLSKNKLQPDIIYAHFLSNALVAAEALKDLNIPIVAAVGEYKNIDVVKSYYKENKYYRLIKNISGFVAVSNQVQNKLLDLNIATKENCLVAPNGVNLKVFQPTENKKQIRQNLGLPQDKKIILFVGRFLHNKGPKRVVKALEFIGKQEYITVLLGSGPDLSESPYIHFKGAVNNQQVADYMAASDLFVLPTLHEGSSNVIVEAMASGLPIVSSNIPEIREQCTSAFSILVDPLNEQHIAEAIDTILSDNEKHNYMSKAAREHAKHFSLENRAQTILSFMKK